MSFKKMKTNLTFTELFLFSSIRKNRVIKRMEQINAIVNWSSIDNLPMENYPIDRSAEGLTINEGIAVDARLRSASYPLSKKKLEEEKQKGETPEGRLDKKGKPLKFSRYLESDWTVKNDVPHFGRKEHAFVDTRYGFVPYKISKNKMPGAYMQKPNRKLLIIIQV